MAIAKGLKVVGYFDCAGGGQVVVRNNVAYVGHVKPPDGTSIIDVSDPAKPRELAQIKVPEGTQSGTSFRIRGKGVPVLNGHGKGDLFVEVRVQTPGKLSKRQRELLSELAQLTPVENKPQRRSLLGRMKDMFV